MSEYIANINEKKLITDFITPGQYTVDGRTYAADIKHLQNGVYMIQQGNRVTEALVVEQKSNGLTLLIEGKYFFIDIKTKLEELSEELLSQSKHKTHQIKINSPMPGLILQLNVIEGQYIEEGEKLFVLEAMKMENVIYSPINGHIKKIFKKSGEACDKNEILMIIE